MNSTKNIASGNLAFEDMRIEVLDKLKNQLPSTLLYHNYDHSLNAETIAKDIATNLGLTPIEIILIRTAALYHDLGFIHQYEHNEELAVQMAGTNLPRFNYSTEQISMVQDMIRSTRAESTVESVYDRILSDADHDYFGRADYFEIAEKLRQEYLFYGKSFNELEWIEFQLEYLEKVHVYWTNWSISQRSIKKQKNISILKTKKEQLLHENIYKKR